MSACISRAGEYSDHEAGDWCPRCGTFNEESIVAERDRLRRGIEDALAFEAILPAIATVPRGLLLAALEPNEGEKS